MMQAVVWMLLGLGVVMVGGEFATTVRVGWHGYNMTGPERGRVVVEHDPTAGMGRVRVPNTLKALAVQIWGAGGGGGSAPPDSGFGGSGGDGGDYVEWIVRAQSGGFPHPHISLSYGIGAGGQGAPPGSLASDGGGVGRDTWVTTPSELAPISFLWIPGSSGSAGKHTGWPGAAGGAGGGSAMFGGGRGAGGDLFNGFVGQDASWPGCGGGGAGQGLDGLSPHAGSGQPGLIIIRF